MKITSLPSVASLHHHYLGQTKPQPCFVELNCITGTLTADYDPEIGNAAPMSVHYGRVRRYPLPFIVKGTAANALLTRLSPLAQRVWEGYSEDRDANSNRVGVLTDDATAAEDEIRAEIEKLDQTTHGLKVWTAEDWLSPLGTLAQQAEALGVTADATTDFLDAKAEHLEDEALGCAEVDVIVGVRAYLDRLVRVL